MMSNMTYINKTILIASIVIFSLGILFLTFGDVQAKTPPLVVQFERDPLFKEANFLPGQSVTRWVKVTNNTDIEQKVVTEAINYPGFPNPNNIPSDDLSRALLITIRKKGGNDLYGGSTGLKYLSDFYTAGETYLSNVPAYSTKEYEFEISFPSDKENEWQEKTTSFDVLVGFQGVEGGGEADGNGGTEDENEGTRDRGSGHIPPGLSILEESMRITDIAQTSVTITWTTTYFSTSQVIYSAEDEDHNLDFSKPNYGYAYAFPVPEDSNKVVAHTVTIPGLTPETKYYFRCISHASPSPSISREYNFTTLATLVSPPGPTSGEAVSFPTTTSSVLSQKGAGAPPVQFPSGETRKPSEEIKGGEITAGTPEEVTPTKKKAFGEILATQGLLAAIGAIPFNQKLIPLLALFIVLALIILALIRKKKKEKEKPKF